MNSVLESLPSGEASKFKQVIAFFDTKKYKKGHNKIMKMIEKSPNRPGIFIRISRNEGFVRISFGRR